METRIILGYPSHSKKEKPFLVYLGTLGSEADTAMAASKAARFEIFQGPGRRKNNPGFDPEKVKAEVGLKHFVPFVGEKDGDDIQLFELNDEAQAFKLESLLKELRESREQLEVLRQQHEVERKDPKKK